MTKYLSLTQKIGHVLWLCYESEKASVGPGRDPCHFFQTYFY